jgi:hypothetical protein
MTIAAIHMTAARLAVILIIAGPTNRPPVRAFNATTIWITSARSCHHADECVAFDGIVQLTIFPSTLRRLIHGPLFLQRGARFHVSELSATRHLRHQNCSKGFRYLDCPPCAPTSGVAFSYFRRRISMRRRSFTSPSAPRVRVSST